MSVEQFIYNHSVRYTDDTNDTVGCYTYEGIGTFVTAKTTCDALGGYLLGIESTTETREKVYYFVLI